MPAFLGDLIRVELIGTWNNSVQVINRFHYVLTQVSVNNRSLSQWGGAWIDKMFPDPTGPLRNVTHQVMVYGLVRVSDIDRDTYSVINSADVLIPSARGTGGDQGDALPPHDAYTIRFQRPSNEYRYGYKRLCGVSEGNQTGGNLTPGALVLLEGVADKLREKWTPEGAGEPSVGQDGASPCLVKAERNGDEVRPVEYIVFTQASVTPRVTTQNTRKAGRA